MKVAILTIPSQQHRIWALMGHLQTIGFYVRSDTDMIKIYQGYDRKDYPTVRDTLNAMIADGFIRYKSYLKWLTDKNLDRTDPFTLCCTWGMMSILRAVAKSNEPTIVIENDAFFRGITKDEIDSQWETLVEKAGYANINVAMFTVIRPNLDQFKSDVSLEDIDDFWVKGACGPGQTANIYTPHGAQYIIDHPTDYHNIEAMIYRQNHSIARGEKTNFPLLDGIYSSREGIIDLHFFSNFDSPHVAKTGSAESMKFYEGVPL